MTGRYIEISKLPNFEVKCSDGKNYVLLPFECLYDIPAADVVEMETIKTWLYEMAINNVGCVLDGDFSNACEEVISRLDGLRNFAKERTPQKEE